MTDSIQSFGSQPQNKPGLREAFDQSVGSTFFRQMLKSLRSSTGKPAYFHGGQAEEIFQSQLDEILISDMAKATEGSFSSELFKLQFPNYEPQTGPNPQEGPKNVTPVSPEEQQTPGKSLDTNA